MRDSRPCIVVTVLLNAVSTAEVSVKCNEGLQEQHVTLDSIIVRRPIWKGYLGILGITVLDIVIERCFICWGYLASDVMRTFRSKTLKCCVKGLGFETGHV